MKTHKADRRPMTTRLPLDLRARERAPRESRPAVKTQSPDVATLLSAMLEKLSAMMERLNAAPGASASATAGTASAISGSASATVGTAPSSGLPNLNPAAGSRESFGGAPVFTGFDAQKLASPLKLGADGRPSSAKYTFAKLAQESGTMPRTKAEAEQWFNQYIKPGLEKEGFGVDWVQGDKALVRTRENPQGEVIDFLRGAGSSDPNYIALAWQSEGPQGGAGGGSATATVGTGGVGWGNINSDFVLSILKKYPPTNDGIRQALEELRRHPGYEQATILEHPIRLDKLSFGNGLVVDCIVGAGGPNPSWGWMPE